MFDPMFSGSAPTSSTPWNTFFFISPYLGMKLSGPLALSEKEARLPATSLVIQSFRWTPYRFCAMVFNSHVRQKKASLPQKEERPSIRCQSYPRLGWSCQHNGDDGLDDVHRAVVLPLAPAPPRRDMTAHFRREFVPATAGGKHVDHGFQRFPGVCGRASAPRPGRHVGLEATPLGIGELVRHF